jgi:diguanylate cyclase (GGDEF)-like protein
MARRGSPAIVVMTSLAAPAARTSSLSVTSSTAFSAAACPLTEIMHESKASHALVFFRHKDGHRVPVQVRSVPIRGEKGAVVGIAESFDEQSPPSERENREHNLAAHGCLDAITGVMNQALIRSYLREHLAFFTEYDLPFGILSIRIRGLQQFRLAHGREAADDILRVVAETMKHSLGTAGFLGRWTDDHFLVIVPNCSAVELNQTGDNLETSVNSSEIIMVGRPAVCEHLVGSNHGSRGGHAGAPAGAGAALARNTSDARTKDCHHEFAELSHYVCHHLELS